MQFRRIVIATAEIKGLDKEPYYFNHHCFWAWSIMFENPSSLLAFRNLPVIYLAYEEKEANEVCKQFKKAFEKANIHEGDTVALICNTKGDFPSIVLIATSRLVLVDNNQAKYHLFQVGKADNKRALPSLRPSN